MPIIITGTTEQSVYSSSTQLYLLRRFFRRYIEVEKNCKLLTILLVLHSYHGRQSLIDNLEGAVDVLQILLELLDGVGVCGALALLPQVVS
jgi:hypothetical protein